MSHATEPVTIAVDATRRVSGLLVAPPGARACYVLAHGAGAGMTHPFMAAVADELAARGIATLRYQFPYMEARAKRPDPPALAQATVRAAVTEAARRLPGARAGRRRQVVRRPDDVTGAGRCAAAGRARPCLPRIPASSRRESRRISAAQHLFDVNVPMLFLQGTRDALADLALLRPLVERLGPRASLRLFDDADHSFHVPARTGRKDADVRAELLAALAAWVLELAAPL